MMRNIILTAVMMTALPVKAETWRWICLADWHHAEKYVELWPSKLSSNGYATQQAYLDAMRDDDISIIGRIYSDYAGELMVIPGDTNNGKWDKTSFQNNFKLAFPSLNTSEEVITKAAHVCYGEMRNAFTEAGYGDILLAVGDHEVGDDPWPKNSIKAQQIPVFKAGQADVFNEVAIVDPSDPTNPRLWTYDGNENTTNRLFTTPIGTVPSRPFGTNYEETSFAYQHNNTLFVTVDVFRYEGASNTFSNGGAIIGDIEGDHMQWFKDVLAEAATIASIKHIVVQAHLPVISPVRSYSSSAMLMDGGVNSPFLQAMRDGNVDLYLGGEVHSNTVTIDPDPTSDLVQWVSRGNRATNFSTVDMDDDTITIRTYKNADTMSSLSSDLLLGTVVIDKSVAGYADITTTGLLESVDPNGLNLHYDFDEIIASSSVLLGVTSANINGSATAEAFENRGEFGGEYTAWVENAGLEVGPIGNAATFLAGQTFVGANSIGPMREGVARTLSFWFKSKANGRQVLVNTVPKYGATELFNIGLNAGELEVVFKTSLSIRCDGLTLNDGGWHHAAVTVPFEGAKVNEVVVVIDGVVHSSLQYQGRAASKVDTMRTSVINLGHTYTGSKKDIAGDYGMVNFTGSMDDFGLWTRALSVDEAQAVYHAGLAFKYDATDMEKLFKLNEAKAGSVTVGNDEVWTYDETLSGDAGAITTAGGHYVLDLGCVGALSRPAAVAEDVP